MMRSFLVGGIGLLFVACSATDSSSGTGGTSAGGSSASGGSSGTIGVGGSSASDGGGTGGIGAGCASDTYSGELVPLDMFVMLDRSGSMADDGKWGAVSSAINNFVGLPGLTGLGMGIAFFPIPPNPPPPVTCATNADCGIYGPCFPPGLCVGASDSCEPTDYAQPVVPIAPLPGVGSAITSAINGTGPNGGTPTRPALQGAMMYSMDWAANHTDHITIVVLATDGEPVGCAPNSISDVAAVATQGLNANPSVKTFVIGVGSQLGALNQIAQAGGTSQAFIVTAGNAAQEFLDALNAIRGSIGCTYKIPISPTGQTDFSKVNVAFTPDGGQQEIFPQVGSAADCLGNKAWYYDDPINPTQIILCPAACDLVTNTKGKVDVVLGCPTVVS
jgi:hypothetical protein